jgi:anti-anti-sigma regulatory factor
MKPKTYNIKISDNKEPGSQTVIVEGDLSFKNAIAVKKTLHSLKLNGDTVIFQLKNVERLDITSIQSIRAIRNSLNIMGKNTHIRGELPPEIERLLKNTGFDNTL